MKVFSGKKRTSYSHGRKRAAGNISDSVVPFQYLVFRLGWVVKNMHTIYDYVHDSEFKDISAAKKLADWPEKGGVSPTFRSITTEQEKARLLLRAMYAQHSDLELEVQNVLFGAFLIGYEEFRDILLAHPEKKFEDVRKHPVMAKFWNCLELCDVDEDLLFTWIEEIRTEFHARNYLGLPIEAVPDAKIDGRPVAKYMEDNTNTIAQLHQRVLTEERKNEKFRKDVMCEMKKNQEEIMQTIKTSFSQLRSYIDERFEEISSHCNNLPTAKKAKVSQDVSLPRPPVELNPDDSTIPPRNQRLYDWESYVVPLLQVKGEQLQLFLFNWYLHDAPMSYVNTVKRVENKIESSESGVMKRLNKLHKTLINFLPKDENGVVDEINKMPNEVEDIIVWKSDLMKKSMCAFKDCCSYLEMSEKSATLSIIPSKYDKKEKASRK